MLGKKTARYGPVHHGLETDHCQSRSSLSALDRDQAPLLLRLGFASRLAVGNINLNLSKVCGARLEAIRFPIRGRMWE
jgi:hypothetical protein